MKKILILLIIVLLSLCSCEKELKDFRTKFSYKDPETMGEYWDVTMQTGDKFEHVRCTYWGTDDDTSVFTKDDGTVIVQSGACTCVQSR